MKVTAVADETSNSLVLSAPMELMAVVLAMVREVDQPVAGTTEIRVFSLRHADAAETADQLSQLFPSGTSSNSDQNQSPVQFGGGPGGPGGFGGPPGGPFGTGGAADSSTTGARARKQSTVVAVADPRTSSLVVTAASALMPQIAKLIEELDASPARKEVVQVYELRNADPQDVSQIMQDLFNRNNTSRNSNNNNRNSLLGQGNPLTTRQTEQQTGASSEASGLGGTTGRGNAGGAGGGGGGF